jgi:zinc protease
MMSAKPWRAAGLVLAVMVGCSQMRSTAGAHDERDASIIGPINRAVESLYGDIIHEKLANGLEVYVKPVPGAATVTTMMAYRVGSSDEAKDHTGLAHYLEHLMFKGTEKLMPGDIDRLTLRNGGANNAYTDTDLTVYHFDFAADRWEPVLAVEADRMRNLRIDEKHEFELEKGAVVEELHRDEDAPWDLEHKKLMPLLFDGGPYGHPVIGEAEHVQNATAEVITGYYNKWYHPNNAVLVIAGGVEPRKALELVHKHFDAIPAAKLPDRRQPVPVTRTQPARLEFESKFTVPRMIMAFNGVKIGDHDDLVLDVVSEILTGGRLSRLYQKLVEQEELAVEVTGSHTAGRYPGFLEIDIGVQPGGDRAAIEQMVVAEISKLIRNPVSEAELKRAIRMMIADQIFTHESVHELADSLAFAATVADIEYVRKYIDRISAVTPADIQKAAAKYLDPNKRVVVWSVPPEEKGNGKPQRQVAGAGESSKAAVKLGRAARKFRAEEAKAPTNLDAMQRVVLPNGLTVLLLENHRLPIVTAAAEVRQAHLMEDEAKIGVAELTGRLLSEGTDKHKAAEIADVIESVGGDLAFTAEGGTVRVLSPDRKLGLSLLTECLSRAQFPTDAFEREQERLLSDIDDAMDQPEKAAADMFRAMVYGKHPLGRPPLGVYEAVEKMEREDCIAYHQRLYAPNNVTLSIAGDFDSKQVIDELTQMTSEWKRADLTPGKWPDVKRGGKMKQRLISIPDAAQLQIIIGHVGVRRANEDFYKLLVMDHILGTGPGFTDRLTSRIRDREGLAYSVKGEITSTAGLEPGVFAVAIGTQAKNLRRVRDEVLEEIAKMRDEPPTEAEVADAKNYLLGSQPFVMAKNETIVALMTAIERFGLGSHYMEEFRKNIEAVTAADVQAMAKKYLDPSRIILVAAGPIDENGKPVRDEADEKAPKPERKGSK